MELKSLNHIHFIANFVVEHDENLSDFWIGWIKNSITAMKISLSIFALLFILAGCNPSQKENQDSVDNNNPVEANLAVITDSRGYELLAQKCYMCHLAQPDPARMDGMLAPPMLRVKEHYEPRYGERDEFVEAVMSIVKNPSEDNSLMPGAIKKFNLMPRLIYDDVDLRLIAGTIYDYDFGSAPKMNQMGGISLELDNGEKWKLEAKSIELMNTAVAQVNSFSSNNLADYNQLGVGLFDKAKGIMLNDAYTGQKFEMIHTFFNGIEGHMHLLMAIQSIDEAKAQVAELKQKLNEFDNYFE